MKVNQAKKELVTEMITSVTRSLERYNQSTTKMMEMHLTKIVEHIDELKYVDEKLTMKENSFDAHDDGEI